MHISVLTFIFGQGYEKLHDPLYVDPNFEYICVTDDPYLKSDIWKIIYDPMSGYTPFRKVVEVRYNPFKYVSYNECFIMDGSETLMNTDGMLFKFIEKFNNDNCDISTIVHLRNEFTIELAAWEQYRNLKHEETEICLSWLKNIGYDISFKGLFQTSLIFIKNTENTRNLFKETLTENNSLTEPNSTFRVDQIVFSALLNLKYKDKLKLFPLIFSEFADRAICGFYGHNGNNLCQLTDGYIDKVKNSYIFNNPVSMKQLIDL